MKRSFAPSISQKVGKHVILWFEKSNKYIVINKSLYTLIKAFLSSKNQDRFYEEVTKTGFDPDLASQYFKEIDGFLEDCNARREEESHLEIPFNPSNRLFSYTYDIDNRFLTVNYGSELIKSLVHPQIKHLVSTEHKDSSSVIFDLYQEDDTLCLFKDEILVGSWKSNDFHLLQGKFAMHVLCWLHSNKEMDWMGTFHASTVVDNNHAAMIIGDSGKGKSTFTALLLVNGFEVVADDLTPILAKDSMVYPYPGGISIKSGAFDILKTSLPNFDSLPKHYINPYKGHVKYVSAPKSQGYLKGYSCKTIISINYEKEAKTSLETISIADALNILIPESWLAPKQKSAQLFLDWIKDVQFYQLTYSDSEEAIKVFSNVLNE